MFLVRGAKRRHDRACPGHPRRAEIDRPEVGRGGWAPPPDVLTRRPSFLDYDGREVGDRRASLVQRPDIGAPFGQPFRLDAALLPADVDDRDKPWTSPVMTALRASVPLDRGSRQPRSDQKHNAVTVMTGLADDVKGLLLNEAIPGQLGDRNANYVKTVFVVHKGAIYAAQTSDAGSTYRGYPYKGRLSGAVLDRLREMAEAKNCGKEFQKWVKSYILRHGERR